MNKVSVETLKTIPKLSKKTKIGWIVAVALLVVVMLIPTTEAFTPQIRLSIAITAAVMAGLAFEILPNVVLGMILLTAYIVTGLAGVGDVLSGFTNVNCWACISAMLLVGCMDQTRVLKKVCYGAMLKLGGSLKAIVIAMMIVSVALGAVIGGPNVSAPMIVIAYALCVALGLKPGSNESALVIISSYVAANAPGSYFYNNVTAMGFSVVQAVVPDMPTITYANFFVHNWPMIIFGVISVLIVIVCFPLKKKKQEETGKQNTLSKDYLRTQLIETGKMDKKDIVMIFILLLVLVGLLTMGIHHLSIAWILMIGALVCFLPFLKIGNENAVRTIKWPVFVFMAATMGIGSVFQAVGTGGFLAQLFAPMLSGMGENGCMFMVWLIATIANFFLTPLASINTLLPSIVGVTETLGVSTTPVFYMFLQGATNTCVLPYEVAAALFMYSYGMCSLKQFVKAMGLITIANGVFVMAVMVPYWHLIGIL